MAGNEMRRVRSGDRFVYPARTHNRILNATEVVEGFQTLNGRVRQAAAIGSPEIVVRNDSGSSLPRFAVVGIDGMAVSPGGEINNEDAGRLMAQPWHLLVGEAALSHYGGAWAVLKDAADDGRTVRAFWGGLCAVPVWFVGDTADAGYADLSWVSTGFEGLAAQHSGRAYIVAKDTDPISSGDLAAMGLTPPSSGSVHYCVIDIRPPGEMEILVTPTGAANINNNRWEYDWSEVRPDDGYAYLTPSGLRSSADLGPFINTAEYGNTNSGTQPDGVFVDGLIGTFGKQVIGPGIVLRIRGPYFDGSGTGPAAPYWISEPIANQYWGACPEDE